jgi:hypothetical protein
MKNLFLALALIFFVFPVRAQETWQADITVSEPTFTFPVFSGTVWLTRNHLVASGSGGRFSPAFIGGLAAPGETNAPIITSFDMGCSADRPCGYSAEIFLTTSQIGQVLAGQWSVVLGENRRQIVFDRICRFMPTNAIEFHSFVDGYNPTNRHRFIRFGRANFGLTGGNFSYEITMPAQYGPYSAFFRYADPSGIRDIFIADLGMIDCMPAIATNAPPDAVGLELAPQCVIRGAICVSSYQMGLILSGSTSIYLSPPASPSPEQWANIVPDDSDKDGVPDYLDHCPDTKPNSLINSEGCSIADLCPCDGNWRNHGDYVRCIIRTNGQFERDGLITRRQRRAIVFEAFDSRCGGRNLRGRH